MLKTLFAVVFGVAVIFAVAGSSQAFRDDIVAAWTFEEGSGNVAHDVSGNGNDGEVKGGTEWVDGKYGGGLRFDGSTGYVEIPFAESMRVLNQGDLTFAAWFIMDEVPAENKEVFQQGDGDGTGRTWLFVASDNTEIRSYLGGGTTASGVIAEAGQWYHGAVVVTENEDVDITQVYVNGEPIGAPGERVMESCAGPYFIGCHKNLTNFWDGVIDDVVMVSRALDQAEVQDLMTNGVLGTASVQSKRKLAVCWGSIKRDM